MLLSYKVTKVFVAYYQGESILADSGTEQLEFIALSQRTGDPKYQEKVYMYLFLKFVKKASMD